MSEKACGKASSSTVCECNQSYDKPYRCRRCLHKVYWTDKLSERDIAERFNCSRWSVSNWLEKHDIPKRPKNWIPPQLKNEEWLKRRYYRDGMSTQEIADLLGVSYSNVYKRMEEHGIERRSVSETQRENAPYYEREWLVKEYVENRKSTLQIGRELGYSPDTIAKWLRKHGIEPINKNRMPSGSDNPLWEGGKPGYGSNWKEQREKARERDNRTCQACQTHESDLERNVHVHHIIPIRKYDTPEKGNELDNLVCLCASCHTVWEGWHLQPDTGDYDE